MSEKGVEYIGVTLGDGGFLTCYRCGSRKKIPIPVSGKELLNLICVYSDRHEDCNKGTSSKKIIFNGYSDDMISIRTIISPIKEGTKEYGCSQAGSDIIMAEFHIGKEMKVYGIYDGCWMFAVGQVEEDTPLPNWPVSIIGTIGYSSAISIEVPFIESGPSCSKIPSNCCGGCYTRSPCPDCGDNSETDWDAIAESKAENKRLQVTDEVNWESPI